MANTTFFGITFPVEFKPILPLLKHAEQVETRDVPICYFGIFQAVKQGFPLAKTPEHRALLGQLLKRLEDMKPTVTAVLPTTDAQREHATNFALKVFSLADEEDRSGRATPKTATSFYAASIFLTILKQFFPDEKLPSDIEERIKYAKWKAADLTTCFKQGKRPRPGGPLEQEEAADSSASLLSQFPAPASSGILPSPPTSASALPPAGASLDFGSMFPAPPAAATQSTFDFMNPPSSTASPPPSAASSIHSALFPSPPSSHDSLFAPPPSSSAANSTLFPSVGGAPPSALDSFFPSPPSSAPSASSAAGAPNSMASLFPSPPGPSPSVGGAPGFPSQQPPMGFSPSPSPAPAPAPALHHFAAPAQPPKATQNESSRPSSSLDPRDLVNAEKFAKYAVSALQFEDIPTAINNLKKALDILSKHVQN